MTLTYAEYIATVRQLQRAYIAEEEGRMVNLRNALFENPEARAYKIAANALGFHPLTQEEITARREELLRMTADAEMIGDSPIMRFHFERYEGGKA